MTEVESQIDLYDSEMMAAQKIASHLNYKYSSRPKNMANITSLAAEAVDLFQVAGMEVSVNPFAEKFTISIDARCAPFDPDRQSYEVKQGVADKLWDEKKRRAPKSKPASNGHSH